MVQITRMNNIFHNSKFNLQETLNKFRPHILWNKGDFSVFWKDGSIDSMIPLKKYWQVFGLQAMYLVVLSINQLDPITTTTTAMTMVYDFASKSLTIATVALLGNCKA